MSQELKDLNLVHLTGRISVKRYNEEENNLFIVLQVSIPKTTLANRASESDWNRDFPPVIIRGEYAAEANEIFNEGDRVSVIGYLDTRNRMTYTGNRMYREIWEPYIDVQTILPATGRVDANNVIICGEITRVYRNDSEGKRFYIITVKVPVSETRNTRTTFTYFDPRMELEPKAGDRVFADGTIQTKRENTVSEETGRRQTRFILSNVSRCVILDRK